MTFWHIVLIASIACVALKLVGYAVPPHWLEKPAAARTADLLTVALLAALIAVQTVGAGQGLVVDARVPALAAAGLLYWLRVPFLVVVIAAALVAAMLRSWGGMA
ncbi:AzlD domain-containing protein [Mycetocola sp.]|uniref:AzlD domain-containing protein n=1 Tax=Mycetocola sp. TaxID=1871042 RepID=UPI003988FA13